MATRRRQTCARTKQIKRAAAHSDSDAEVDADPEHCDSDAESEHCDSDAEVDAESEHCAQALAKPRRMQALAKPKRQRVRTRTVTKQIQLSTLLVIVEHRYDPTDVVLVPFNQLTSEERDEVLKIDKHDDVVVWQNLPDSSVLYGLAVKLGILAANDAGLFDQTVGKRLEGDPRHRKICHGGTLVLYTNLN